MAHCCEQMKKLTQFIGTPPEMSADGRRMSRTGSVNFVALCSKCGVPCLPGEVSEHQLGIRWGYYISGEPVCDPCYNRETEAPNAMEKQYQRIMKNTYGPSAGS